MSVFSMAGSNPALPTYPLQRSVRLRSSASAYFSRTPTASGNRKTWTWSGWIKRGVINTTSQYQAIFTGGTSTATASSLFYFGFWDTNGIRFSSGTFQLGITTAIFRDPSAWYHVVVAVDTTQATADNRIKLYVNGVQIAMTVSNLAQNDDTGVNATTQHSLGQVISSQYFDGYLEEINFIDGQALTPSSFGAYNSYGVWSPAKYTGTYGTNGFYLNFQDNSALTTTANVGIGKDSSGNGNYWTSNNISITAGTTYDSMLDVPTLTSATNSNYAVLNPIAGLVSGSSYTLSNGNLQAVLYSGANVVEAPATMALPTTGKWYWETTVLSVNTTYSNPCDIGISDIPYATQTFTSNYYYYVNKTGNKWSNGTATTYGATFTTNDIIGVAFDADAGTLTFYKNNTSQGTAFTGLTGTYYPKFASGDGCTIAVNFGQRPFSYTPPTGFNRLCTYNLPDSIVPVGAQYMAATTYTGNSSTNSLTNTVNGKSFQPDFVWIKNRTSALSHYLNDSVRGVYQTLFSNLTSAEYNGTSTSDGVSAFNTSGFTVLNGTNVANYNQSANNYVAWQWRASNASAVTNTAGSITSQVSANQTAGFSIVTWTGNGTAGATVGHGLGVIPALVIYKARSATSPLGNWITWHRSIGQASFQTSTTIQLNGFTGAVYLNATNASSTYGFDVQINGNGSNFVAYCFAAVPGYSAFGSYTGNGSTDGPFVYLGFRPRYVMIKRTDGVGTWYIMDSSRLGYNQSSNVVYANLANAEANFPWDLLSNGFKARDNGFDTNGSGSSFIYIAFAENPFKNSLAR